MIGIRFLATAIICIVSFNILSQEKVGMVPLFEKWPVLQDRQGYIWYLGNSGNIGRWLQGDPQSDADIFEQLSGCDYVNIVEEDKEGHIWIANGCRFYRYDPIRKKFEDIQQAIFDQTKYRQLHTESWCEDDSGKVWFGGGALISYTIQTQKIDTQFVANEIELRFNLFSGSDNTIWFSGLDRNGLDFNQYSSKQKKLVRSLKFPLKDLKMRGFTTADVQTERIVGIGEEKYIVYIGGTVNEFDPLAGTLKSLAVPKEFGMPTEICSNDRFNFVGTNEGALLLYKPADKSFQLIWQHSGKKAIESLVPGKIGSDVFAYVENGMYPINLKPSLFHKVFEWNPSSNRRATIQKVSIINGVAYLTWRDGTGRIDPDHKNDTIRFNPALLFPNDLNYTIGAIPGSADFWLMVRYFPYWRPEMRPILNRCDSKGNILKTYQSPVLDTIVKAAFCSKILTDANQNTWIFSTDGTIGRFDGRTEQFELIKQMKRRILYTPKMILDKENNLWIGGRNFGLLRYDKTKNDYQEFLHDPLDSTSISSDNVTDIYTAKNGLIWMGTSNNGLSLLNPSTGKATHLGKMQGLPELFINRITEDRNGDIWVGTQQYICKWVTEENRFIVFNNEDGLWINPTFSNIEFFQESKGPMYFRTDTSLYAFDPDSTKSYQSYTPDVLLAGFSIGSKKVTVGTSDSLLPRAINAMDKINLNYSQNRFTIQYAAIDFYGNIKYAYQLVGFDDGWQQVKNKTEAIYTNVPPGNYTFQVKAMNHQGFWSPVREIAISVKAPWYRSWLAYGLYASLISVMIWAFIRFRSRYLIKENQRLEEKVTLRANELSTSLKELKETQNQLIQREKMASLGELTAGIAHEIQNPLNFMNNFSEVNTELIDELKNELAVGNLQLVGDIVDDIKANEQKINHHGKRADAIVKGMLQHSRSSSGAKESTDINALSDEYLRLSYHGLRAKDKSFNATINTDFDDSIGLIAIIPQDIGRVVLNLLNNAFYAVDEEKKTGIENFEPTVSVSTKKLGDKVEIRVSDNGNGIPEKALDKIFQPFFTTKPTGEGTGLGLSLSYEIITKGHGGELTVETKEGEGTTFILQLPSATG